MKAIRKTLIASAAVAALSLGMASAHAISSVPAKSAESTNLWFVELQSPAAVDGGNLERVRAEKAAFRQLAAKAGLKFKERQVYERLFNGLSIEATPAMRAKLSRLGVVKAMYPVSIVQAPKPVKTEGGVVTPDMASALGMTGADYAQNVMGLSGAGIKVGIIDSGIDIDHPDLNGGVAAFPNPRAAYGYDFVGDAFNADPASPAYNPVPVPDANPDDCGGHGTHVAGIIGANGVVKGVAPQVTYGAYRVFGCAGSTTSDVIVSAMEMALADGMQVINQSLGASFQWPDYPTAKAADGLVKAGVVMVASIGNSGTSGLYAAGAPGVGKKVIGVASFDNNAVEQNRLSAGGTEFGYFAGTAAPVPPTSGSFPLARTGTTASTADGCSALPAGSLTGQVALIRRGTCTFYAKAFNAQAAGAAGVIVYNNVPGVLSGTFTGTPAITIPAATVSDTVGAALDAQIAAGGASMTWLAGVGSFPNSAGGLISSFSSWGLAADLSLKPNLGAPGGFIKSTYPLEFGGYATLSGTSMSSPHTAGGVALMLQADPSLKPDDVKARLQNSAKPKPWTGGPTQGFTDMVHRQGAGMIDLPAAMLGKTVVTPSELSLGESEVGPVTRTLTLRNRSNTAVTYDLSHQAALATGASTFAISVISAPAGVAFSANSVTVPAKGKATVDVTITANAGLVDKGIYGGYVVATAQGTGEVLRVPFAGFKGDYQSIPVLTSGGSSGFPWLAQLVGTSYQNRNASGATYTMAGSDIAYFLLHLDHHSRKIQVKAYETGTNEPKGVISLDNFLPRSSTSSGFFTFGWDGTTSNNGAPAAPVANGSYYAKISVLKALGDPANPAHWETFTTNTITIARPAQ